ncbi:hypothetical protein D9615_000808 [Tricholomella constricta]|uniref:Ubiquitin-like domain-containing protein n=1 Tax=Tricholomella constricta TaxID=117010 RepID=A0A8H5MBX4_9AGAR|nr:hypothetical protein D9615_000808 [Tricholomella constricta]
MAKNAWTSNLSLEQTLTGKEIELDIDPDDKISRIKEKVEEQAGVPPQQQRLIFLGKQIIRRFRQDDKTAKELNVTAGAVLHLVLALRGGQRRPSQYIYWIRHDHPSSGADDVEKEKIRLLEPPSSAIHAIHE